MIIPAINQAINMVIRGKNHLVTCLDVFDAGYGIYFDAVFADPLRVRLAEGEQCAVPGFGNKGLADYASRPKHDSRTVRFLLPKWL